MVLKAMTLLWTVCILHTTLHLAYAQVPVYFDYDYRFEDDMCLKAAVTEVNKLVPCEDMIPICDTCNEDRTFCGSRDVMGDLPTVPLDNAQYFAKAAGLTHLSLARRRVSVSNGADFEKAFELLPNLTCVSLDHWRARLGGRKWDIKNKFVEYVINIPTVRQVSAVDCDLTRFILINNTAIEMLDLSQNGLGPKLNMSDLCQYDNLTEFALAKGGIQSTKLTCPMRRLQKLDLSSNKLDSVALCDVDGKSLLPALQWLNMSGNGLLLEETFPDCLPALHVLDLSGNQLQYSFKDVKTLIRQSPNLSFLVMNNIQSKLKMPHITASVFDSLPLLRHLYIVNNSIDYSDRDCPPLNTTQYDYEDRYVHKLYVHTRCMEPFRNCSLLEQLVMDGNDFSKVYETRFLQLFKPMKSLKTLSMRRCAFDDPVPLTVLGMTFPALESLDLSDNKILYIPDGAFDDLLHFHSLHMENNQLRVVNEKAFRYKVQDRLTSLSLLGNPLVCSCDVLWFKLWMASNPGLFSLDPQLGNRHVCKTSDTFRAVSIEKLVMPRQACIFSKQVNIFIIINTTFVITIFVTIILVFRYRWHFRLILHEAFRGQGNLRLYRLQNNHFDYDVFVSYASENLPWVRRHIMPELEDRLGLRLCVHDREFIPGKNIVDNIVDCVEKSKKIVMLFSKDFKRSQWCQFELAFCLRHVMDYDDSLIVVCLDDVASHEMTSAMIAVMKTTTYIQWSEDPDAVRSFWPRMKLSLHEIFEHGDQQV